MFSLRFWRTRLSAVTSGRRCVQRLLRVLDSSLQRICTSVSTRYTENGFTWIPLGNPATIDFGEPVIAGVPFSNASGDDGYAHIGSIRYRRLVNPEPSATLAAEDQ